MKFQTLIAAVIATAISTNAFALVQKKGVVESINLEEKTISIATKSGRVSSYKLADSTKVIGADAIQVGHVVTLKISGEEAAKADYVTAQILSVNAEANTAVVREKATGNVRTISFSSDVNIKGRGVDSVGELAEGHIVKVRFASN